ncbi:MAG: hypothetical protein ACRD0U_14495 [Acidimicrobiales bacterium]
MCLVAFDVLMTDGEPVTSRPFTSGGHCWRTRSGPTWTIVPCFTEDLADVFVTWVQLGFEGAVAKRRTSRYRGGPLTG